ncbi:GNAT family N-acetyltransferase [Bradyrhizobium sp. CB1015]|uniref:GNAT family N-acetyltransferase n=1 Tax=Bradyrhizobium sp. CB1015 TaxID=2976822 RepID=UPI0021AB0311|nr:GNAT family protein [Bradyrhizobium sp. CB1015]UWU92068.1 GNAT family N-acetyltransferase [Bradyrhizobium sp. CB1015]
MTAVVIARITWTDANDIIGMNNASRDLHEPWIFPCKSQEEFDNWFGRLLTGPNVALVARVGSNGPIVGIIELTQIVWGLFRSAYTSFYSNAEMAGSGAMTEAGRLGIKYAFDDLKLHRLEANIQPNNNRSLAFVKRLGFEREGFSPQYLNIDGNWRDHERWTIISRPRIDREPNN